MEEVKYVPLVRLMMVKEKELVYINTRYLQMQRQ